jgi:hypothetical protein
MKLVSAKGGADATLVEGKAEGRILTELTEFTELRMTGFARRRLWGVHASHQDAAALDREPGNELPGYFPSSLWDNLH